MSTPGAVPSRPEESAESVTCAPWRPWERDDREWKVSVSMVGRGFHVAPVQGMMGTGNWALNPYHRTGVAGCCAYLWRCFSGAYIRSEYPRTERRLRRAIAQCEAFIAGEKERAETLASVLERVQS